MNLLEETIEFLKKYGLTPDQVEWVGQSGPDGWACMWHEFAEKANFNYDSGFGAQEINEYLIIVGKDWWLSRTEYDGAEGWCFNTMPVRPAVHKVGELRLFMEQEKSWLQDIEPIKIPKKPAYREKEDEEFQAELELLAGINEELIGNR